MTVQEARPSQTEVMQWDEKYIARTFNRQDVVWDRGRQHRLWDIAGKEYLDFFSGHAVMNLGYGHPAQKEAMQAQLDKLVHNGNLFHFAEQALLAKRLVETSFGDKVFFANSGAEIVDLAIKLARKWARRERPQEDQYEIITLKGSFHGRTFGALSATGQDKYHQGVGPMLPGFKYVQINNFAATASAINNKTCAIMIEPVQGEGGIHISTVKYIKEVQELCKHNRLLLILDEIQCGLGRIGYFHAYQAFDVVPDVLLLGKPLGGGLPLSALVTRQDVALALTVGEHGSTFGGNPVAAAAGRVLLNELDRPGFLEKARKTGAYLGQQLGMLAADYPDRIVGVRGTGLMWGLELKERGPETVRLALEAGLVINCTAGQVLRFLPALTITPEEVDEAVAIIRKILAGKTGPAAG
ncbi:acetylornithine transaminase [candidate division FCPU426 bacterium]|nr:acetylornithine transaminase [candidate division FCPU426 bacterium]